MLLAVILLQLLIFAVLLVLLLRKAPAAATAPQDPRHAQLPDQITHLHARHEALHARNEALDTNLRGGLADLRREAGAEALTTREANTRAFTDLRAELTASIASLGQQLHAGLTHFREDNATSAAGLRTEVTGNIAVLGQTLKTELGAFRSDNAAAAGKLHADVHVQHEAISQRLNGFAADTRQQGDAAREALHTRLTELAAANNTHQEKLRATVEGRLEAMNTANTAKLEEMRQTVDEKLHATLQTRLTESFGQVTTHLGEVQKGLGEMKELATGVGDLKKVLGNVKARGIVGEFQLGQQLEQMFSPEQYIKNARIKPNTTESVEFALKFPSGEGPGAYTLLPIDAKFPKEDWERLEHAYEHGSGGRDRVHRQEPLSAPSERKGGASAKSTSTRPPPCRTASCSYPTESALRRGRPPPRPPIRDSVQQCRVTIAGPSTFMAILTSFQMGFHTLAIQKKGDEVWRVLSSTKNEFEKFGGLMDKVRKQVDTVQNTLGDISGKTKTINRALKNVASLDTGAPVSNILNFEEMAGVAPLLAAAGDDD